MTPDDARQLLDAANYLYEGVWNEFRIAFNLDLKKIAGATGRIFANFNGMVLPTEPLKIIDANPGSSRHFEPDGRNADAYLRAYWPFVRRVTSAADYRQFIACGVMDWQALYITSLGSPSELDYRDENRVIDPREWWHSNEIPARHLPEPPRAQPERKPTRNMVPDESVANAGSAIENARQPSNEPVRFLFLTKEIPDRKQIGRVVQRVCTMGSMRLFALKDYSIIREASTHIRMHGQELDTILSTWHQERNRIERNGIDRNGQLTNERVHELLSKLSRRTETRLIHISAFLDHTGIDAVGGLPFRINRSRYYVAIFRDLLATLRVKRIERWISYEMFVKQGLEPAFSFIDTAGARMEGLRERLRGAMLAVQTSAIVAQTESTRDNTVELKRLQQTANTVKILAIITIWFGVMRALESLVVHITQKCGTGAAVNWVCTSWDIVAWGHRGSDLYLRWSIAVTISCILAMLLMLARRIWLNQEFWRAWKNTGIRVSAALALISIIAAGIAVVEYVAEGPGPFLIVTFALATAALVAAATGIRLSLSKLRTRDREEEQKLEAIYPKTDDIGEHSPHSRTE